MGVGGRGGGGERERPMVPGCIALYYIGTSKSFNELDSKDRIVNQKAHCELDSHTSTFFLFHVLGGGGETVKNAVVAKGMKVHDLPHHPSPLNNRVELFLLLPKMWYRFPPRA